ncbi:lipase family protein [Xenorhabdus sp. IM139775]|uniref:lipase family protein n=1 Tax=Xenorhabdus sp. IM139775 TaxID=3025876 RepID=UPI002359FB94|nr:lipase family protein [Xenorhabdus sp. IM139775]MDC9594754.1 lipase family protein [Xenorhabdus sp. IM139775]
MYTYKQAANFAAFVLYAMEMNTQYYNHPTPPADPRINEDGWRVIAYLSADDLSFSVTPRKGEWPDHVCYGYVAEKNVAEKRPASGEYIVAIRGTDPTILLEDIHDGLMDFSSPWTRFPKIAVSQGFFSLYDSMKLIAIEPESHCDYSKLKLAEAITQLIGKDSRFTIVGHSLGAAIASYLMYEIGPLAPNHSACLFACPRPGNKAFSKRVSQNFSHFAVFNYIDDVVPHLPPEFLAYASLDPINEFKSQTPLDISDGPLCNHYLINYIARLDLDVFNRVTKYGDIDSCINR